MSESSVFQNIGNVLSRIDEIKRKYGVDRKVAYPGFDYWLEKEVQAEQIEAAENLQVEKNDTQRIDDALHFRQRTRRLRSSHWDRFRKSAVGV